VRDPALMVVRRRVFISGLVQGVWFRESCRRRAGHVEVTGWIRNTPDGSVEAVFEGPPDAVDSMVEWCRHGPPHARVDRIGVTEEAPEGISSFTVR
jgi:acylphosphatase